MKFPSIFKNVKEAKQPWQWSLRTHPKTLSFRAYDDDVFTTVDDLETRELSFLKSASSFATDDASDGIQSLEMVISGVRLSKRLFFDPEETSSIMKESQAGDGKCPFKDIVALSLESADPYLDFKKSMQEIVDSQGIILLKDWDCLEELLGWYLRKNGKMNHGFIVGAFVDLLVGFAAKKTTMFPSDATTSFSSSSHSIPAVAVGNEI